MATKTLYVTNTAAATPFFGGALQDGGSAPSAANSTYGWTVAKGAANLFWKARLGASALVASGLGQATSQIDSQTAPQKGTGSGATTAGDSFWAGPYSGTFGSATSWVFDGKMRAAVASSQTGRLRMRVWKSANADGTGATELTGSTQVGTTTAAFSTTADVTSTVTWTPGTTITLSNQYLFFQIEWQAIVAGGSTTADVHFRVGTALITTPDFSPSVNAVVAQTLGTLVQSIIATTVGNNKIDSAANYDASRLVLSNGNLTLTRGTDSSDSPHITGTNARFPDSNQYYFEVTFVAGATSGWCTAFGLSAANDTARLLQNFGRGGYSTYWSSGVQGDGTRRGAFGDSTYGVKAGTYSALSVGDKIGVLLKAKPTNPPTVWNIADCEGQVSVSTSGLRAGIGNISGAHNVRANKAIASGQYFEIETSPDWNPTTGVGYIGLANANASLSAVPTDANSVTYGGNGTLYSAGSSSTGGATYGTSSSPYDVIGVHYTGTQVKFYKNGVLQYTATTLPGGSLYPIVSLAANWLSCVANFDGNMYFYGRGVTTFLNLPSGASAYGDPLQSAEIYQNGTLINTFPIGTTGNETNNGGGALWPCVAVSAFTPTTDQVTVNFGATAFSYFPSTSNTVSWDLSQTNSGRSAVVGQTLGGLTQAAPATVSLSAAVAQALGALVQVATDTVLAQATITQTLGVLGQAAAIAVASKLTAAQTLGPLGQTTTAAAIDSAVVAQILGALSQAAASTSQMAITVAQNLGALTQSTAATHPDTAAAAQTLGAIVQTFTGGVVDAATAAQTLGALGQAVTATVSYNLAAAQILAPLSQAAAATDPVAIAASHTLGVLAQAAAAGVIDAATVAQALGALGQTFTGGVVDNAVVSQALGALVQAATATLSVVRNAAVAQTLGVLGQAAAGTVPDAAVASQALSGLAQVAAAGVIDAAAINQALGVLGQAATGAVIDAATAAQTLGALQQAVAVATTTGFTAAQTLGNLSQALTGKVVDTATVSQSLGPLGQVTAATHPDTATTTQALGAIVQALTGVVIDTANVSQALGALNQTATASASTGFIASQVLAGIVQSLTGTSIDHATVAQSLSNLGQTMAGTLLDTAAVSDSLGALGQVATSGVDARANVAQVLGALAQLATADLPAAHAISDQILGGLQQVSSSNTPESAQATQVLGLLNQVARLRLLRINPVLIKGSESSRSHLKGSMEAHRAMSGGLGQRIKIKGNIPVGTS